MVERNALRCGWSALIVCFLLAGLAGRVLAAQDLASLRADTARFYRLTVEQGLSQNTVHDLLQDRQGFLWVATQNGLTRFDGHETRVFRPQPGEPDSIPGNYVQAIELDGDGELWVGTLEGLARLRPQDLRFDVFRYRPRDLQALPADVIKELHRDHQGRLWIATEQGLARWQPASADFRRWNRETSAPGRLPDARVNALASDPEWLWIGTSGGLFRLRLADDSVHSLPVELPFAASSIRALFADRRGRLWVSVQNDGLYVLDRTTFSWQHETTRPQGLGNDSVQTIYETGNGSLWIGTDAGVERVDSGVGEPLRTERFRHHRHNPQSLGAGRISAIVEDSTGSLWFGTFNNGVSWIHPQANQFHSYTAELPITEGLRNASSIALLAEGEQLLIGTGEGSYRLDWSAGSLQPIEHSGSILHYSAQAVELETWFGTSNGLRVLPTGAPALHARSLPEALSRSSIRRLLVEDARVWMAADPAGLALLARSTLHLRKLTPLARSVTFIRRFDSGRVLVGAYDGLHWFNNRGELIYQHRLRNDAPADPNALALAPMDFAIGPTGEGWLATNGAGLMRLQLAAAQEPSEASITPVGGKEPLSNGMLKALQLDAAGRPWVSRADGISVYLPELDSFRNFGRAQGTLNNDYINASGAVLADGRMLFGGMDGFTLFQPAEVLAASVPALLRPVITALELAGVPPEESIRQLLAAQAAGTPLLVPAEAARQVSISFASLDYAGAGGASLEYRLEPFDSSWQTAPSGRREVAYLNLLPGNYVFRLRSLGHAGQRSEEASLPLLLKAYWWQTLWAQTALALTLLMLLFGGHRYRLRRLAHQQAELERQIAERTAALAERSRALEEERNRAQQALDSLQAAQVELLRSEKMAALGQLVAGVAHEVNTPLGVAITAASHLRDATRSISRKYTEGAVRKSDLEGFLGIASESAGMIERNLDRAGHLIANFKQVSVDRTSDGRREFKLHAFLNEVLESLELMWKRRAISMQVECPDDIVLDGFPGALGQVITNLTQNAVVHAFAEASSGQMTIQVRPLGDHRIELRFSDNGRGIAPEHQQRVFEPFFTTRRGQGGTGLGLNIVYNLITQKLGGEVSVESALGKGTTFTLRLPIKAPE